MIETPSTPSGAPPDPPRRRIWVRIVAGGVILLLVAGVVAWWNPALVVRIAQMVRGDDTDPAQLREVREKIEAQEQALKTHSQENAAAAPDSADRDAEYRRKVLGRWTQSLDDAERELILHPDGTALQVIYPKGFVATSVLGDRVEIDVLWKVENGRAIFDSIGGRPADMAQRVNDLFGTHRDRRIVEITDKRILLFDEQDNKPSEWLRASAEAIRGDE
jgi:hypothetical protein